MKYLWIEWVFLFWGLFLFIFSLRKPPGKILCHVFKVDTGKTDSQIHRLPKIQLADAAPTWLKYAVQSHGNARAGKVKLVTE